MSRALSRLCAIMSITSTALSSTPDRSTHVADAHLQRAFDERLTERPRAHAVGRELLAREVHQPDVAFEFPFLREPK